MHFKLLILYQAIEVVRLLFNQVITDQGVTLFLICPTTQPQPDALQARQASATISTQYSRRKDTFRSTILAGPNSKGTKLFDNQLRSAHNYATIITPS
jgi:hypothetical protein